MDNTHRIVQVKGYYEAYNSYGEFVVSGDTYKEVEQIYYKSIAKGY